MCLNHEGAEILNAEPAGGFADRMVNMLNEGALCLMTSIGHRTGLFDTMADMPPATSAEIAARAALDERYVREWLNAMTTARIVEYDAESRRYTLPGEHAAFLGRKAASGNIAVFSQYIPLLGAVENDIVNCFRHGGGVPYARYGRFHEVMAEDSGQTVLSSLFAHILPLVPGLVHRLERGIRVLDLGCGSGRAVNLMAAAFPASRFTGYDLSPQAVDNARRAADAAGLGNVVFEVRDLSDFDLTAQESAFDFVTTFDAVHDQGRPRSLLKGIRRTLKDEGVYLMQDIHASSHVEQNLDHPVGPLLYTVSCMHCMSVSLAQGGDGLGAMWGREKAGELLREAGFGSVEVHQLPHDFQNDYYVIRKAPAT